MKKIIKNAQVVLETGIIWDGAILIEDDKILAVGLESEIEIPADAEVIDAEGAYVGPGFVDIHCHGGNGYNVFEEPEKAGEFFLKHGTTSLLSTPFYSMNRDEIVEGIRTTKKAMATVKNIKGLYLEGPYTNPDHGAHSHSNPWRCAVKPEDYKPMVDEGGTDIKVWTVAPERPDLMPFLEYARKVNPDVVIALGHSKSTPEHIRKSLGKYQPTLMTHFLNATGRAMGDEGGLRGYGPDEYCYANNDMYAELISDSFGIHVHSDLQRMVIKVKGYEKVVLITDSTCSPGDPPEKYAHIKDLNYDERGGLSGSKLTLDIACRNVMKHTNCGIAQAFVMASGNPAKVVGLYDTVGSIEPGKMADLVFVDDRFNVKKVMLEGEVCKFN